MGGVTHPLIYLRGHGQKKIAVSTNLWLTPLF
nr:MAG TPA: hypothetical protein [Caudoviricetes sp.]